MTIALDAMGGDSSPAAEVEGAVLAAREYNAEIVLVGDEKASAVVSAGHTGAAMAASLLILGPVKGVERPAIAAILPTLEGVAVMLDVGANVDCKPKHLYQFAIMGHAYAVKMLQKENPRIGLLSIGEEDTKGNILTRETFRYLTT